MATVDEAVELLAFTSPQQSPQIRQTAAAHIRDLTGAPAGARILAEAVQRDAGRQLAALVRRCTDPDEGVAKACLEALVNLAQIEAVGTALAPQLDAIVELVRTSPADTPAMLLHNVAHHHESAAPVLTRTVHQVPAYLLHHLCRAAREGTETRRGLLLSAVQSVTRSLAVCQALAVGPDGDSGACLLRALLSEVLDGTAGDLRRRAVAGVVRNCLLHESLRDRVVSTPELHYMLDHVLAWMTSPGDQYSPDERMELRRVFAVASTAPGERDSGVALLLAEILLLLGSKQDGREWLRTREAYAVVREFHRQFDEATMTEEAASRLVDVVTILQADDLGKGDGAEVAGEEANAEDAADEALKKLGVQVEEML